MSSGDLTIFCLPFAGGGPMLFKEWSRGLPGRCKVHAVALPGRGVHVKQTPIGEYRALVRWLARYIHGHVAAGHHGRPHRFALFGHSAGARFCFGAAAELESTYGLAPLHCFLAANAPPHMGQDRPKRSQFSDEQLTVAIQAMGGTAPEVLADTSLLPFVLPILRADLRANEQAIEDREKRLACPFTLFAWNGDAELKPQSVWQWEAYTSGPVRRVLLDGHHFSVRVNPGPLLIEMACDLHRILTEQDQATTPTLLEAARKG